MDTFFTTMPPRLCATKMIGRFVAFSQIFVRTQVPSICTLFLTDLYSCPRCSQAIQQVSCKMLESRPTATRAQGRIVSKSHDAPLRKCFRQKVLKPILARGRILPCLSCIAIEAVDCHQTIIWLGHSCYNLRGEGVRTRIPMEAEVLKEDARQTCHVSLLRRHQAPSGF
jgi:hypothetical protein